MEELTPHQLQTYWTLKELFPHVSGDAIRANVDQGAEGLAEMILAGELPTGDEFLRDSDAPIDRETTRIEREREERREREQTETGGFWGALAGTLSRISQIFLPQEADDSEPALTDDSRLRLERILDVVDAELFERASSSLPHASLEWILLNIDFGLEYLLANLDDAPPRGTPRRDKQGISHLVQTRLSSRRLFECSVCFSSFSSSLAVVCTHPSPPSTIFDQLRMGRHAAETHSFCADCVRGHAGVAVEQNVIAPSGIGLKCMQPGCSNVLLRAHCEQVLDSRTRAALEPHYAHEALTAAGLQTESCPRCGFTAHIVESPEEEQVFNCRECDHQHCRRCNRVWDEKHQGKSCVDMMNEEHVSSFSVVRRVLAWFHLVPLPPSTVEANMRVYRETAERLTAMTVHECPRCKKKYQKSSACNKITCPCGQESCYVCGAAIEGYGHFTNIFSSDATACALWEDTGAREAAAAAAQLQREIAAAPNRDVAERLRLLQ